MFLKRKRIHFLFLDWCFGLLSLILQENASCRVWTVIVGLAQRVVCNYILLSFWEPEGWVPSRCSWDGCADNHSGIWGWPWRLSANSICFQNTELALRFTLASCNLDWTHWPKSARVSWGQMAQIIVRKIIPRTSNKWTKIAFSAACPRTSCTKKAAAYHLHYLKVQWK